MADDESHSESTVDTAEEQSDEEATSFRERVEELRERKAQAQEEREGPSREGPMEELMGAGAPGTQPGMGAGNPLAQMMAGMMGGGLGGAGGRPEMGRGSENDICRSETDEELLREVRNVRDELHDIRRTLQRIGDAIDDA